MQADCINLLIKYYKEAKRAISLCNEDDEARAKRDDNRSSQLTERTQITKTMEVKSKTRAGGRCCVCFDPFSIQNVSIIAFFCCHAYHLTCLIESAHSVNNKGKAGPSSQTADSYYGYENGDIDDDEEENDESTPSGMPRMRCILCTTAAG